MDAEAEYNNRARVPGSAEILATWMREAEAFRTTWARKRLDVRYGDTEPELLDLFLPEAEGPGPLALFIHGGYWQALDKTAFSHMAAGANAHGLDVAVMSYDLCPAVKLAVIVDNVIACIRQLRQRTGRRVLPFGHSAGGHLTACMAAADWARIGEAAEVIAGAMPVSGLFHLAPLVPTFVNRAMGMDAGEAAALSPLVWTPPKGLKVTAVVGGDESGEYHRQTRMLVECWGALGAATREIVVPGANHFTVIAPFAEPASALTAELLRLAA